MHHHKVIDYLEIPRQIRAAFLRAQRLPQRTTEYIYGLRHPRPTQQIRLLAPEVFVG